MNGRCVGVIGGVWVCTGWTIKVGSKVTEVVTGPDKTQGIVAAEATGIKKRWGGGELRARTNVGLSPYNSYAGTPMSGTFSHAGTPVGNYFPSSTPVSPLAPPLSSASASPQVASGSIYVSPPPHATSPFPPSPLPGAAGFPSSPNPRQSGFPSPIAGQGSFPQSPATPDFPPRSAGLGHGSTRSFSGLRNVSGEDELKKVE